MSAAKQVEGKADRTPDQSVPRRMIDEVEVLALVPISRTTLFRLQRANKFPKSVHLSPNRRAWFLDEIVRWQKVISESDPHFNPDRGRGKGRRPRVQGAQS
jgi:predicted DNA-binding transcriptional regulator AlpA